MDIDTTHEITTVTKEPDRDEYWGYWETCDYCGERMIADGIFCPKCGKRIKREKK